MHSMTQENTLVVGGVDAHADTHHAAALDERGALLATQELPDDDAGLPRVAGLAEQLRRRSTSSRSSRPAPMPPALVRYLAQHDVAVVEVNQPHAHTRRRVGKSDPIDAEMAARLFQAGKAKAVPKQTDGIVESIRLLRVARDSAVKSRSAALVQLRDLIITAPQELRDQLSLPQDAPRQGHRLRAIPPVRPASSGPRRRPRSSRCARPLNASKRSTRRSPRSTASSSSSSRPPRRAPSSCSASRPGTPASCSSPPARTSSDSAARARSPMLCGASPIPASSGKTTRHRLNYGGDRQANRALHLIAVCRLRYCAAHPRLRQAPHRRRQDQARDHALPQALHRARGLQLPPRRPRRHRSSRDRRSRPPSCAATPASESTEPALDIYRNVPAWLTAIVWRGRVGWSRRMLLWGDGEWNARRWGVAGCVVAASGARTSGRGHLGAGGLSGRSVWGRCGGIIRAALGRRCGSVSRADPCASGVGRRSFRRLCRSCGSW